MSTSEAPTRAVVIQASGTDANLPLSALRHAKNLIAETGEIPVEIVVQSGAVMSLIAGHPVAAAVADLRADLPSVRVLACRNAMRANNVDPTALADGIETVPAGIAWLSQRQWDGWAYVWSA